MNANATKSSISLAIAVLLGVVTLAAVPDVTAQDRSPSDREARTATPALGTPVVRLTMTFAQPIGLTVQGERSSSPDAPQRFATRPLDADGTQWGIYAIDDGASAQAFDVIVFRDHLLVNVQNDDATTGLVLSFDREAELVDAVASNRDDVVALASGDEDLLPSLLDPTVPDSQLDQAFQDPPFPPCCNCPTIGCSVYPSCPPTCSPVVCPCGGDGH